jgi:hypothetical protein
VSALTIRSFRRSDRDQVAELVNLHAGALVPGASVPVNTVLGQFERQPGEFIVDPWVAERHVLVAEQNNAIVAAMLLLRYRDNAEVGSSMRTAGEIRWLLFKPIAPAGNPHWTDGVAAAEGLALAALDHFRQWGVDQTIADGALPTPGVYGVPEQWPHVAALYERIGFRVDPVSQRVCGRLPRTRCRPRCSCTTRFFVP